MIYENGWYSGKLNFPEYGKENSLLFVGNDYIMECDLRRAQMDWLNNNAMLLTQKTIESSWAKQRLTLDNIANVDTPGYKAKYAVFGEFLADRLEKFRGNADATPGEVAEVIDDTGLHVYVSQEESMRLDGNNVNIDVEQLELTRNAYEYQFALRQISDQLTRLRTAIEGR